MPDTQDTGRVMMERTYLGQYQVAYEEGVTADTANVMVTKDNAVQLLADVTLPADYAPGAVFMTLPTELEVLYDQPITYNVTYGAVLPVAVTTDVDTKVVPMYVGDTGGCRFLDEVGGAVAHLAGLLFHIAGTWYKG